MNLKNLVEKEYLNIKEQDITKKAYEDNSSAIKDLFNQFLKEANSLFNTGLSMKNVLAKQMIDAFSRACRKEDITSCAYTREDITLASLKIMQELKGEVNILNGIFLTNLIQLHYEKNQIISPKINDFYNLITEVCEEPLDGFGYQMNGPTVHIQGSVGYYLGYEMIKGSIILFGDAYGNLGESMKGGTIHVTKSALSDIGHKMENGTITISENCKGNIGMQMSGGNIVVEKNAHNYIGHSMCGGRIHIKGDAYKSIGKKMNGGEICIEGSCKTEVGHFMQGGTIHIKKKVGRDVGREMYGGEIRVDGEIEGELPFFRRNSSYHGKIFQNGKQVFPKVER